MKRHQFKSKFLQISISSNLRSKNDSFLNSKKFKSYVAELQNILTEIITRDQSADLFLKKRGIKIVEASVTLCGSGRIKSLNREFRQKDKVTDVLSFQMHDTLRGGDSHLVPPQLELGDIYICYDVATNQAKRFGITLQEEFLHLFVHGFLHLLGFDHELSDAEEKIMTGLEDKILKKLSGKK